MNSTSLEQISYRSAVASALESTPVVFDSSNTSGIFDCGGSVAIAILPDEDFTGSVLSLKWSIDGLYFYSVQDATGNTVSISVSSNTVSLLTPSDLLAFRYVKFVSDQSETASMSIITRRVA